MCFHDSKFYNGSELQSVIHHTAFVGWQVHDVLMKEFRNDASESTSDKLIWNQTVSRLQVLVTFIFSGLTLLARAIVCFVQTFRPVPAACWITGAGGTFVSGLVDMLLFGVIPLCPSFLFLVVMWRDSLADATLTEDDFDIVSFTPSTFAIALS